MPQRLIQLSKKQQKLALRPDGDIKKFKQPVKPVEHFKGKPPTNFKRVVNNAFRPARMLPSQTDHMKFRQEIPQDMNPRREKQNKAKEEGIKDNDLFVRVGNTLMRNEGSVLDQAERAIFSRNIKRDMVLEINGRKLHDNDNVAEIMTEAHVAEKGAHARDDKNFLSEFTGPTETLVEVPELKQDLDNKQIIRQRIRLGRRARRDPFTSKGALAKSAKREEKKKKKAGQKFNKNVEKFIKDFGLSMSMIPSARQKVTGKAAIKPVGQRIRILPEEQAINQN